MTSIRKKKFYPKVRLGGLAIAIGFVGCFILTSIFFNEAYQSMFSDKLTQIVIISGFLIFLVGLADDIFVLQPWPRLIAQFTVCFFCWLGGLRINIIDISWIPFINGDVYELSLFLSLFITLFWIVGVINSINWLDGMDGLAASYTGLVSIGISIISLSFNHTDIFFIAILTTSCCLAFLKYNLNPSSILMGDGGSYLLGFLLAIMSLLSCFNEMNVLCLHLPAFLLSLSILDMIFVISKRLLAKRSPFYPDRQHIQHRILNLGLDEKSTLFSSILFKTKNHSLSCLLYTSPSPRDS